MSDSSATSSALADTNIVVYAHDPTEADKHDHARQLLGDLMREGRLVLSAQTLNEFYAVATRPGRPGRLSHDEAVTILRDVTRLALVAPLTPEVTFRALEGMPLHGLSFWDALIWAAAKENGVPLIYSEDFQDGRDVEGVLFRNPFLP